MEEAIAAWEDEGGSADPSVQIAMTGTVNQIGWAGLDIKTHLTRFFISDLFLNDIV